jgi:hypothetical protein
MFMHWSRQALAFSLGLFLFALTAASCEKEKIVTPEQLSAELEGDWRITSCIRHGEEYIGARIESATITFVPVDAVTGTFVHRITYVDTERIALAGRYSIDARKEDVRLTFDDVPLTAIVILHDGRLTCRSRTNGYPMAIDALRVR